MADTERVRDYLERNLSRKRDRRDRNGIIADIGVVDLRDIAAEVAQKQGYEFKRYDSEGVSLKKGRTPIRITRRTMFGLTCRLTIE
ncbi:MAG: hypothetical protein KKB21_00165 [Nanoarchaeota archaeon]|nr:hypothetical protein [Nanoarchaeota archaeon]